MRTISQLKEIKNKPMTHANHVYTLADKLKVKYTSDGFLVGSFKLKNNKNYNIHVISNKRPTNINLVRNLTKTNFEPIDEFMLDEFFINGMNDYLRFDSEAYFRIVCEEESEEVKFIFTDYNEAVEYLGLIEKGLV